MGIVKETIRDYIEMSHWWFQGTRCNNPSLLIQLKNWHILRALFITITFPCQYWYLNILSGIVALSFGLSLSVWHLEHERLNLIFLNLFKINISQKSLYIKKERLKAPIGCPIGHHQMNCASFLKPTLYVLYFLP